MLGIKNGIKKWGRTGGVQAFHSIVGCGPDPTPLDQFRRRGSVRAIERKLMAAGCDWHDLAYAATTRAQQEELEGWRDMMRFCEGKAERLRPREKEFIEKLSKWRGDPTEKQQAGCWTSRLGCEAARSAPTAPADRGRNGEFVATRPTVKVK
jgi:hypothetical protein